MGHVIENTIPSIQKAIELGKPIIPIYILDDDDANNRKLGDASKWWLHNSLQSIHSELEKFGRKIFFFLIFKIIILITNGIIPKKYIDLSVTVNALNKPNTKK